MLNCEMIVFYLRLKIRQRHSLLPLSLSGVLVRQTIKINLEKENENIKLGKKVFLFVWGIVLYSEDPKR